MPIRETFVRTLQEIAEAWGCDLETNPSQTKFVFRSPEMPTRCIVHTGMRPARSWERSEFGDFIFMRWERFLGKVSRELNPFKLLTEDYEIAPPFYGMCEVEGVLGLFLIDKYHLPWTFSDNDVYESVMSRYGMGLVAFEVPGVELHFDSFDSIFWTYSQDAK